MGPTLFALKVRRPNGSREKHPDHPLQLLRCPAQSSEDSQTHSFDRAAARVVSFDNVCCCSLGWAAAQPWGVNCGIWPCFERNSRTSDVCQPKSSPCEWCSTDRLCQLPDHSGLMQISPLDSPAATLFWATPVRVLFYPSR